MRTGYAIRDRRGHAWLKTRQRVEGVEVPVTVWVPDEEDAMLFNNLKDARHMLKVVRATSRHPGTIHILDPHWKEVG